MAASGPVCWDPLCTTRHDEMKKTVIANPCAFNKGEAISWAAGARVATPCFRSNDLQWADRILPWLPLHPLADSLPAVGARGMYGSDPQLPFTDLVH